MPALIAERPANGITRLTNGRLLRGDALVEGDDLWVSSATGKIVDAQAAFYDGLPTARPAQTVDLGGRILAPGFIDAQLNGAFGLNFSTVVPDMALYAKALGDLNRRLVQTGVTSYVPTVTSQTSRLYRAVLPHLAPSGARRAPADGAESLGAHCEGPFLNPRKHGVHNTAVLRDAARGIDDLDAVYGAANLDAAVVRMVTVAPELGAMTTRVIPALRARGIVCALGHSEATYDEAAAAVAAGATMVTHLFNAMRPPHHRDPGIFGVLAATPTTATSRPYFGVIADGIHLHPNTVSIAHSAHRAGLILVSDAMHMVGLPDGRYAWTNGDADHHILKRGSVLTLEGTDSIAGSSITLIECANNLLKWSGGATVPAVLRAVTAAPAEMLGLAGVKGSLDVGADADLVVLSLEGGQQQQQQQPPQSLVVDEVWKFGERVFRRGDPCSPVVGGVGVEQDGGALALSSSSSEEEEPGCEYVI